MTPVDKGSPVPLVKVMEEGVSKAGVVKEGEVEKTTLPVPEVPLTLVPWILETVVLKDPALLVTSPLKAGKRAEANVPVAWDPDKSMAALMRFLDESVCIGSDTDNSGIFTTPVLLMLMAEFKVPEFLVLKINSPDSELAVSETI